MKKKSINRLLILGMVMMVMVGCQSKASEDQDQEGSVIPMRGYHQISAETAKQRMDSGDPITVIDVREPSEYEGAHIPGAILMPLGSLEEEASEKFPNQDQEILVYCRSGRRSAEAAEKLAAMGYTQVYDFGGILSWPYETE